MEIHQLVYFIAVAETSGFSRAAERCSIAQPSLSQQIIKLENELGYPLFERMGRKVFLTDAGRLLLPRARAIVDGVQDLKSGLRQDLDLGGGALSVGFIPTIAPFVLPQVVRRFTTQFPHACLDVHENLTAHLVQGLIEGWLDVAIMSLPIHNPLVVTQELRSELLLVASPAQHELVRRVNLKVQDLEAFPFISLSEVHCLGEQVAAFCSQQNLELKVVCHTSQLSTVQSCVGLGMGISLVPQALAEKDPGGQIHYQPLSDAAPQRKIAAGMRAGRPQSLLARQFIEIVKEEYPPAGD
jgi:LysR family transcriptional regulator, hydrogen peroxide-inducible genes activator